MEIIRLVGYTEEEKCAIGKQYLVPKQIKTNGLSSGNVTFSPGALKELVRYYTRESGVRSLEREIGSVFRKMARKHLEKYHEGNTNEVKGDGIIDLKITENVTEKSITKYLGARRFRIGLTNQHHEIGLCTGLAWTEVGGDLLVAEVSLLPGKGKLTCTGKLGEVMQESAQAALSYVRSRSKFLGLDDDFYAKIDIHIHVPEGAIPKDGPSAGIAMATALTSALTNRPISKDVAMTGEITLRGRVLPIGGLKEKIIAAHRGGIKKVLIPKDNEQDIEELPKQILKEVTIVPVEHMDTVLMHALVWRQPGEDAKDQDELFEKLRKITETEVGSAELAFAH
jgi:ATP-dependent Lon protease